MRVRRIGDYLKKDSMVLLEGMVVGHATEVSHPLNKRMTMLMSI